jgi:hypothetical protein
LLKLKIINMKNLFFIFLTLFTICSFSQNQDGLSSIEFQKLKKAYVEMTNSESYRAMRAQSKLIASKLNGEKLDKVETEEDFNKWILQNISKTKFSSIDEANSAFKLGMELTTKVVMTDHKDVYAQLKKASQSQRLELIEDEFFRTSN